MKQIKKSTSYFMTAILAIVLFSSCEPPRRPIKKETTDESKNVVEQEMNNDDYLVVTIDSCEYVVYSRSHGLYNAHSSGITHKGNCKFCAARHSDQPRH